MLILFKIRDQLFFFFNTVRLGMRIVQQVFDDSGQRYGANRIKMTMQAQGIIISKEHVLKIMHELRLEAMS